MFRYQRQLDLLLERQLSVVSYLVARNILELHIIDRYTFLIVCPIVMICHFIIILTFVRYKLLKHSPEDVVFAILIAEGLLNMSLFSNASKLSLSTSLRYDLLE